MAENASASRIRWDDAELHTVASEMVRLEKSSPGINELEAVRAAQQKLPRHRQREIKTWSVMQPRLQPKLDEIRLTLADLVDKAQLPDVVDGSPAQLPAQPERGPLPSDPQEVIPRLVSPRQGLSSEAAHVMMQPVLQAVQSGMAAKSAGQEVGSLLDPLMVEASLIAALQSPAVLQALEDSFSQAMAKSFAKLSNQVTQGAIEPSREPASTGERRVLLAGFSPVTAKEMEAALQGHCEVRVWKPHQGLHLFQTLSKVCQVAVIPEEMDEDIDQDLRARNLSVIRHSGNVTKLVERLDAVFS